MRKYAITAVVLVLGANAAAALSAPTPATLSLGANPNPIVFGHATVLNGKLTGAKAGGKKVDVQADFFPYENKFIKVSTVTTSTNGSWTATVKPPLNARFRAHQGKTNSPAVTVLVRIRVSLKFSDRTPKAGRRVRFFGRACPQHDGSLVRIQRRTRTKKWRTVRRTRLRDLAGSSCSRFSKRLRVFRDGTFRAVVVSNSGANANGRSPRHRVNAHR
jgi:hypothetical protein